MCCTDKEEMNADVTAFPAVNPWSQIPNPTCVNITDTTAAAWLFSSQLPAQTSVSSACETMEPDERCCIALEDPDPSTDPQNLEAQLDFFHKLGYSTAQVQAVQQKFGPHTDTDKMLGELVKIGASLDAKQGPVTTVAMLVPRGDIQSVNPAVLMPVSQSGDETNDDEDALRPIVIDGSNVAMSHGNKEVFSCLGIQLAVNFFLDRGHTTITVFVPSWRKEKPRPDVPITDQHILRDLERKKILVFTPSKRVAGKRVVCHDDRYIVKLAYESNGIIVSNDMYRDLQGEKPEWKRFIEERLLMYSFVNNKFMPPDDPLGRHGPTLENFLRRFPKTQKKQPCPYGKKCTFGIKCKYYHPERTKQSNQSLADELRSAQKRSSSRSSPLPGQSLSLVEDMAKKLTLENGSLKKEHKNESVAQVKGNHRSTKKTTPKKEKSIHHLASDHGLVKHSSSQEQLDSGLGSIDTQPLEPQWSDQHYGLTYGGCQAPHSGRQQFSRPTSAPCSCCSHACPSHGTFQHHGIGPTSSHSSDMMAYGLPAYTGYNAYPVSVPAYSQPTDFQHSRVHQCQQQMFWSDPFGVHPPAVCSLPEKRSHWESPQPNPCREEREVVRKKLLAIFSAQLVDTAMDMFPQVMDPQMLAAEILMLQSQNRAMR